MLFQRVTSLLVGFLFGYSVAMQMHAASDVGMSAEIDSDEFTQHYTRDVHNLSALVVTSACPSDELPVGPIVEHRLRMLVGEGSSAHIQSVILYNQPPWMTTSDGFMTDIWNATLNGAPSTLKIVDYRKMSDPRYLARFFNVTGPSKTTVRELLYVGAKGAGYGKYQAQSPELVASNFLDMLHFLEMCTESTGTDICIHFDSDIFIYRNRTGIIDLVPSLFEKFPTWVAIQPPRLLLGGYHLNPDRSCAGYNSTWSSGRYLVVNRTRLLSKLPLRIARDNFLKTAFEFAWTQSLAPQKALGQMACGNETVAMHPAVMYTDGTSEMDSTQQVLEIAESAGLPVTVESGTTELINRVEQGRFQDNFGGPNGEDMLATKGRIKAGLAW